MKKASCIFNTIARDILYKERKLDWYSALSAQVKNDNKDKIVTFGNTRILLKRILLKTSNNINEVFVFQKQATLKIKNEK